MFQLIQPERAGRVDLTSLGMVRAHKPIQDYATSAQFEELMRLTGLPENTPPTNAFFTFAHAPAARRRSPPAGLRSSYRDRPRSPTARIGYPASGPALRWAVAGAAGVSDAQLAALERGEAPACLFADRERTAFAFADEVLDACRSADDTLATVRQLFSPRQVVELLLLIGYFRMVCGLMTTLTSRWNPRLERRSWISSAVACPDDS